MKIIVCGLGEVGTHLSDLLVREGHELTVIEQDPQRCAAFEQSVDARVVRGSGTNVVTLKNAGAPSADILLALTSVDEVNLITASLARALGTRRVIARNHSVLQHEQSIFNFAEHFGIDYFVSPERLAAAALAKEIRSPLAPIIDQFARGTIEVVAVKLKEKSKAVGQTLLELNLPPRMRVGILQRQDEISIPRADTTLAAGDELVLIGSPDGIKQGVVLLQGEEKQKRRRIVLYGAGDVGYGVLDYFSAFEVNMKVIEPDLDECERLNQLYPWVSVVHGEAIHTQLLLEENVMEADVFVAATRDDENNVMSCLQAAKLGIRPCMLVIHRPDYAGILSDIGDLLGIQSIVSPRLVAGNELMRYVTDQPFLVLWEHRANTAQMIQLRLQADASPLYDTKVRDIKWPDGVLLIGIDRADGTIVPSAEDEIRRHDSLLLLTLHSSRDAVLELFRSSL
ncbi:MAG: Trk system potassium transporter TrkA [Verrucomicrobiota bacterium]